MPEEKDFLKYIRTLSQTEGPYLPVRTDLLERPDGQLTTREVLERPNAVSVLAERDGNIIMVRQWRHAIRQTTLETPAGLVDAGESEEAAARRELEEETGFKATNMRYLGRCSVAAGWSTETIICFEATGLQPGTLLNDPEEVISVEEVPIGNLLAMGEKGLLSAATIATIALGGLWPKGTRA